MKYILDRKVAIKTQKLVVANKTKWSANIGASPEALKIRKSNEEERKKQLEDERTKRCTKTRPEENEDINESKKKQRFLPT